MNSNLTGFVFLGTFGIVTFILALFATYGLRKERKKDTVNIIPQAV
jgi:ABC-type lipoprotein release transport system permease subunit